MTSLDTTTALLITQQPPGQTFDEEQMAAASFLARYNGRTLDTYRDDLRGFFQWAHDHHVEVMNATRPHIKLFRVSMEQRELAASTIDRRPSTVCGFYKFAHIDGIISSNPAQYVQRPRAHPTETRGLDRTEFGVFLFTAERFDRRHRTLKIIGKGRKPATIPLVPRTARTIDLAVGERQKIGSLLGTSAQAAQQRCGALVEAG